MSTGVTVTRTRARPSWPVPLIILAFMSITTGFLNVPTAWAFFMPESWAHRFETWVEPSGISTFVGYSGGVAEAAFTHASPSVTLAITATALALVSGFVVWTYYQRLYAQDPKATEYTEATGALSSRIAPLAVGHKILVNKYYLDHLYTGIIAGFTKGPLARAAYWVNQNVLDGVVNTVGKTSVGLGRFVYNVIDQGVVDGAVNASGKSSSAIGGVLRGIQTGQIRQYATLLFGAAAGLVGLFILFV